MPTRSPGRAKGTAGNPRSPRGVAWRLARALAPSLTSWNPEQGPSTQARLGVWEMEITVPFLRGRGGNSKKWHELAGRGHGPGDDEGDDATGPGWPAGKVEEAHFPERASEGGHEGQEVVATRGRRWRPRPRGWISARRWQRADQLGAEGG